MAAAPTAMDIDDEGAGGGARNQSTMVVEKSDCTNTSTTDPLVVGPEPVGNEGGGGDTTECSSSFGDTCSGIQDAAGDGEPEVNSSMSARANGGRPWKPPRKKVTAEWRNSVRPILWRCQWLELRMRELSSQVSKYDRELALNKKQKELQAASKANGSMSEPLQIHKGQNSIMKRRKRKRHEENLDTTLYINKHEILSYYDKQNKRAETDGLLIDDDCGSTVPIRGGLDSITLLDSEDYDVIFEQLSLKDILLMIDGVQSRVHLLQDRLRKGKAHSEGRNLAFSESNTHVRVAQKRQHTQKCSSYTECRYTKPQKKKNLNLLLKDDKGSALSGRPLPDKETITHIKDANRIAEERSGEGKRSREKAITVDLLLGIGNSISNGYIEDLCKENADDILIDNQATNDVCQQFDKAKHLPSGTSSKKQNICAPVELRNTRAPVKVYSTCAPAEVDTTCAPVEVDMTYDVAVGQESSVGKSASKEPFSSGIKQEPNSKKKKRKKGSLFTRKKQRKEASKTPAVEKTEGTPLDAKNQTESAPSAVGKLKTETMPSAATGPRTMTARSAGKKRKSVNEPADTKECGYWNSFSASMEQKTGKPSSAVKKQKTEKSSTAAKGHGSGNLSSALKEQKTEKSSTAAKEHGSGNSSSASKEQKTGKLSSTVKKQKTEKLSMAAKDHGSWNSSSASKEQKTGKLSSAVKKQKTKILSTAAKEHGSGNPSSASKEQKIWKLSSAVKKQKTEILSTAAKEHGSGNLSSASKEQKSGKLSSTVKQQKTEILYTAAKEHGSGKSSSAWKEQKTGKGSLAVKKQETEHSSASANKQEAGSAPSTKKKQATENSSSKAQKAETAARAPSMLQVEKAVLMVVDGRRSQRVPKPKVFAE